MATGKKHLIIPSSSAAGYAATLRDYFSTYHTNPATFYSVNFTTINTFEVGSIVYPAVFHLSDVLEVFDKMFRNDGTVNQATYMRFLTKIGIGEDDRYAPLSISSRLREDILAAGLAAPFPSGRKAVVPGTEHIHQALCKRLKDLSRSPDVDVSRFLPAFDKEIQQLREAGSTQSEIAAFLSSKTKRSVHQVDISRFLKRTNNVLLTYERKKQRAIMTKDMAEQYAQDRMPHTPRNFADASSWVDL